MFAARLGSLNAIEQLNKSTTLLKFINADLPSADTLGRVFGLMRPDTIRQANREIYTQLKRNKALETPDHGLIALNIDGHESHATYKQRCEGCLKRTINKGTDSEKDQFYHRHVTAQLVFDNFCLLLDIETQLPGEGETVAAQRLLERILKDYPRAFDVVVVDALYCGAPFINLVIDSGKDIVVVAKDDRTDLIKDSEALLKDKPPSLVTTEGKVERHCWDEDDIEWQHVKRPLRIVKAVESKTTRRQLDKEETKETSSWMWVTTLKPIRATTLAIVRFGHGRWKVENNGFREMVLHWFSDHVYRHDPIAILNFWLLCMMAYNVFHCFYFRNLKPARRLAYSMTHVAREVQSELYAPEQRPP